MCYDTSRKEVSTLKDRIVKVRKHVDMTQTEFGKCTGASRSMIASYEGGKVEPDETWIELVCLKFDVNPEWFRDGIGPMFVDHTSSTDRLIQQYDFPALVGKLLDAYQQLPAEHQPIVLGYAQRVVSAIASRSPAMPDQPQEP